MPDRDAFESRLADAMRRYAHRVPTDVDAMALAREIATASSKEADRRPSWWPFGRPNQVQGRSRMMFPASGATAVAAVAALGAALALSGLESGPDQASVPPGAEAPMVGEEWAFFTGTLTFDGLPAGDVSATSQNRMIIEQGAGWTGQTMVSDDPRMTGERTEISHSWSEALLNGIWTSLVTIENAEGGWTCSTAGVFVDSGPGSEIGSESGWCDGERDYEGLRAFIVFDLHDAGPRSTEDVCGYITSGDGPLLSRTPTTEPGAAACQEPCRRPAGLLGVVLS